MNTIDTKQPLYSKLTQILVGIIAFFYILYIGQEIIIPLIFSILIAILLNPIVSFLCDKKMSRVVAILLTMFITFFFISALVYFMASQATMFNESFPQIKKNFSALFTDIVNWISNTFNISESKIYDWIEKTKTETTNKGTDFIGQTIGTITGMIVIITLLPVYIFMFLYYKQLLLDFISQLFKRNKQHIIEEVLFETKSIIQNYLIGLLVEAAIVAFLNSIGLFIIGVDYAILLGIIGALLNIIPYIGGVIATVLPMLVALGTKDPISAIWVLIAFLIVQFIDNNYIVPIIVARKVQVNALVAVIVVLIGGALWGISGMFLAIPLTSICKVIFDRVTPLKPFGFLIGEMPSHAEKKEKESATVEISI